MAKGGIICTTMRKIFIGIALLTVFFSGAVATEAKGIKQGEIISSTECAGCHAEISNLWKISMHSQSLSDPIFMTAYKDAYLATKGEAKKLCLNCHAPITLINGDRDMQKKITNEGVTCHFCHSIVETHPNADPRDPNRFRLEVGSNIRSPKKSGTGTFHNEVFSSLHKTSKLCAGCHEYDANGIKIMGTYSEWKEGPYAKKGIHCQTCHMPRVTVGKGKERKLVFSHSVAGGHSLTQIEKALKIEVNSLIRKENKIVVELTVENVGSGHSLPTGIPTRKLLVYCEVRNGNGTTGKRIKRYEKILFDKNGKELTSDSEIMQGLGTKIAKDNRIMAGEKRKERFTFYIKPEGSITVTAGAVYLYRPVITEEVEMKMDINRISKRFKK